MEKEPVNQALRLLVNKGETGSGSHQEEEGSGRQATRFEGTGGFEEEADSLEVE